MNSIGVLHELGQSLWYDNIERRLLLNGELQEMILAGEIRGLTSNPTIFQNAIARSSDYDADIEPLARQGLSASQIFEHLAISDIRSVADLLSPCYLQTHGCDGYVSLEVNPELAYNTDETVLEAKRLWDWVARPNLMIKIPATLEGLPAIRKAIALGCNVNITLIFSLERYRQVMDAYLSGLEDRIQAGLSIQGVSSVASFFVSRMDTKVDKHLSALVGAERITAELSENLLGKAAIANARLAYQEFRRVFEGARFLKLKAHGAKLQRPLWASTSTKNPRYPDTMYVDSLIGSHTVNTVPPVTLIAFKDHGKARISIEDDLDKAKSTFDRLENIGIRMDQVTYELEQEGVKAFADSFVSLLQTVHNRISLFAPNN